MSGRIDHAKPTPCRTHAAADAVVALVMMPFSCSYAWPISRGPGLRIRCSWNSGFLVFGERLRSLRHMQRHGNQANIWQPGGVSQRRYLAGPHTDAAAEHNAAAATAFRFRAHRP